MPGGRNEDSLRQQHTRPGQARNFNWKPRREMLVGLPVEYDRFAKIVLS